MLDCPYSQALADGWNEFWRGFENRPVKVTIAYDGLTKYLIPEETS